MRTLIGIAVLCAGSLVAQDSIRQQALSPAAQKWLDAQIALGHAGRADSAKRHDESEKQIADIARKQSLLIHYFDEEMAYYDRRSTLDPRDVYETAEARRARVMADEESRTRLDSIRRGGQPSAVLEALVLRQVDVRRFSTESDIQTDRSKRSLRDIKDLLDKFRAEDNPSKPPAYKSLIKSWITLVDRSVELSRAVVAFESKRSTAFHAEATSLEEQVASGKAALQPESK